MNYVLVVLFGLSIGLGHRGHSGRCCADRLLVIQIDDGDGDLGGPFVGAQGRILSWLSLSVLARMDVVCTMPADCAELSFLVTQWTFRRQLEAEGRGDEM